MTPSLDRNLRLIPVHELLVRTSPWIAVFVLFTRANFELEGAIRLAGIYYLAVVAFEVPSGWMSDRLGRVLTLRIAAGCWIGAFGCFLAGVDRYGVVVAGQILLAAGYASLSGTDVTFHYDTLEALGRADEFGDRQARISSRGLVASAAGALAGGLLGLIDLRWAFAGSLLLAVAQLAVTLRLAEPQTSTGDRSILRQIGRCFGYLRDLSLAWIFGYGIAMVVLEHVAFELFQPWLTQALGDSADDLGNTPVAAGVMVAVFSFVGAGFARQSTALADRFGVRTVLVSLGALSAVIVTAMAASTALAVLLLVGFRSAQGAAGPILISAAAAPLVEPGHRATFLSLDSLAGRLSFGSLLLILSVGARDDVSGVLTELAVVSWTLVALTAATAVWVYRRVDGD